MLRMIQQIDEQYYNLLKDLQNKNTITFTTLGPPGTSSANTLQYLIYNLKNFNSMTNYTIKFFNTFDEVLENLCNKSSTYALVPCAYERITEFFWNAKLSNCFSFMHPTPFYGLAAKESLDLSQKKAITIAVCLPVLHLISEFAEHIQGVHFKTLLTPSTTQALEKVLAGQADMAITNETSLHKYKNLSIKFISKKRYAEILWCLFSLKNENQGK